MQLNISGICKGQGTESENSICRSYLVDRSVYVSEYEWMVKCSDNIATQLNVSGICKLKVLSKKLVYVDRI